MAWDISSWRWVLWNLMLAAIPVAMAYLLSYAVPRWKPRPRLLAWLIWLPLLGVWLAFLPNTCYLLTEPRHFLFDDPMPQMLQRAETDRGVMLAIAKWALFFLVYSGLGAACFVLAIRPIHRLLSKLGVPGWTVGAPFFVMTSFGVYLGLIVRLNSWDIAHRAGYVWTASEEALNNPTVVKVVIVFALLLYLLYWMGDVWVDGFSARISRWRNTSEDKR